MSTARDLIKASLRTLGVLASGENPSADEQQEALSSLNRMLGSWSAEGLLIPNRVIEEFTLTIGQGSRTIGTGGNFSTTRPIEIDEVRLKDVTNSPNFEMRLDVINIQGWADIRQKDLQSNYPTKIYYEPTYPLGTIYIWPVPSAAHKIVIYSKKPISSFASANDTVSLQPGYEDALVTNLAMKLAPEYGKQTSAELQSDAANSKANIMRMNSKMPPLLAVDQADYHQPYNIYSGGWN